MGYRGVKLANLFVEEPAAHAARAMADAGGEFQRKRTEELTPTDSGHLRSSWKKKPVLIVVDPLGRRVYESGVETGVDYAPYVEWGTGLWGPKHAKYPIRPKKPGGWLHWVSPDGQDVFAKLVMHPGSPGRHMVAIAVAESEGAVHAICEPALQGWKAEMEAVWAAEAARGRAEVRR
jgi:hypothetical protein